MNPQPPRVRQIPCSLRLFTRLGLGLAICLGLLGTGCGNRGPLYLPGAEETAAVPIDQSRETPAGPFDIPPDGTGAEADALTGEAQDDDEDDDSASRGG
jgi:predicted small lipoprotein YifL